MIAYASGAQAGASDELRCLSLRMADPVSLLLVHPLDAHAWHLAAALAGAGYVVIGPVRSGDEALLACARVAPDLALVSEQLAGPMSADRLLEQLWRRGPVLAAVLLANEPTPIRHALAAAQPLAFIPEGTRDTDLLTMVALALRQRTALQRTREPDERFFEVAVDLLCFLGFSGYFRRLSPSWEQTLGFTRDELMSRPFIEFVHPDDRERTLAQNRVVREGGRAVGFENRYRCKDGSYRWLRWNAAPDREHGVIYSVARDVTETRRAAEEREELIGELQQAIAEVKSLREIIPICSYCRKVRDDDDFWHHVEAYIHAHTGSRFSHGVCPDCHDHLLRDFSK